MSVEHLVSFNIALLIALVSPGPALLVAIQTSLSEGRRAGISVGCGLGLMAATWTMSALLGLEVIFKIFSMALRYCQVYWRNLFDLHCLENMAGLPR